MDICPAFIDETGVLNGSTVEQPVYGIGLLVVADPVAITDSLYKVHFNLVSRRRNERRSLRKEILTGDRTPTMGELDRLMWATQHHEYKFSAVTDHNIQEYVDLLNVYFSFSDVEFHAMLIDRNDGIFDLAEWSQDSWHAYCVLTRELVQRRLNRRAFAIADLQGKPDKANHDLEHVLSSVHNVAGCFRATSDMSVYLQLVDVLLGCVQFDWKDNGSYYEGNSARANAKRQLAAFVKSKLGVARNQPFLNDRTSFKRWTRSSTFSVWLRKSKNLDKKRGAAMSGAHLV